MAARILAWGLACAGAGGGDLYAQGRGLTLSNPVRAISRLQPFDIQML
jgi:hypothetical protein